MTQIVGADWSSELDHGCENRYRFTFVNQDNVPIAIAPADDLTLRIGLPNAAATVEVTLDASEDGEIEVVTVGVDGTSSAVVIATISEAASEALDPNEVYAADLLLLDGQTGVQERISRGALSVVDIVQAKAS